MPFAQGDIFTATSTTIKSSSVRRFLLARPRCFPASTRPNSSSSLLLFVGTALQAYFAPLLPSPIQWQAPTLSNPLQKMPSSSSQTCSRRSCSSPLALAWRVPSAVDWKW
ncbi:hypothetical protein SIIN_5227_T [Serendipita indica DSM 11827]|nr:hypothetical protein SIIN_5227_T [Serendipita indica DSM 11827]